MNRLGKGGCIMKTRSFFMLSLAVMAMSCAKEVLPENNPEENVELKLVPMEFTTALETKAGIVDGEGTVEWAANDQITVFDNLGGKNTFTTAAGGASSVFTGKVAEGATEFYALYPQRTSTESVKLDVENKVINSKLFPNQNAVLGSYAKGNGGAVMVAKADAENRLAFKNMTSHIRFTLAEDMTDVKSITLMGNKNEILAGTYKVDFSGGEPVLTVDKPETYVTLSREDGEALVPGHYFFTVLPVEFEEGFTVILSMKTDGSQVAKKTTSSITSLNQRNQVLPMAKLASTDYEPHMNYFVKYNDGFDLTFGGYTFNNKTHEGGKLVNVTYGNTAMNSDGLYFVDPYVFADNSLSNAFISKNFSPSSYIVVGSEKGNRSRVDFQKQLRPQEKGTVFLLANLDLSMSMDGHSMAHHSTSTFTEYGAFVYSDCHFREVPRTFMSFTSAAVKVSSVVVEDCDYSSMPKNTSDGGTAYFLGLGTQTSEITTLSFRNNVFYFTKNSIDITDFKVVSAKNSTISNVLFSNNTLVGMMTKQTGFMQFSKLDGTCNMIGNLFVNSHPTDTYVYMINPESVTSTTTGAINSCFYYVEGGERAVSVPDVIKGKTDDIPNTQVIVASPKKLDTYPLDKNWSPATGIFGAYVELNEGVGAQRTTTVSPETANYAAANYVSVDYGTL